MAFPSFIQSSFILEEAVNPESAKDSVRYPRWRRLPKDSGDRRLETVPANLLDREFTA
ncbi:hypothetical protein [Bradyrhizobium yuanmingense]|uniref:hypothetical protein n=1 Tax=Bradyrhizobium yuanmingense TaxID=108015 RepID=UPI001CD24E5B|nr:hypothetical protein [Bradyrhizobium yuanmingense]MCA1530898.1 hypothetical protein [Bradyrhizobium yuanmingense]